MERSVKNYHAPAGDAFENAKKTHKKKLCKKTRQPLTSGR